MCSGADNGTDMVCSWVVSREGCHRGGPGRDWLGCIVSETPQKSAQVCGGVSSAKLEYCWGWKS